MLLWLKSLLVVSFRAQTPRKWRRAGRLPLPIVLKIIALLGYRSFFRFCGTVKLATEATAGRDAWFGIRRGQKDAKGQQSLESAATLTLGSMLLARFSTTFQRQIDLTNAFKSFFRDNSFKLCSKNRWIPWSSWGAHARLRARPRKREAKGHKVWNLPCPLP